MPSSSPSTHDVVVVEALEQERVRLELVELEQGRLVGQALRVPAHLDLAVEDLGLGQRDRVAGGQLARGGRRCGLRAELGRVGREPERDLAGALGDRVNQCVARSVNVLQRLIQAPSVQHPTSPADCGDSETDPTY